MAGLDYVTGVAINYSTNSSTVLGSMRDALKDTRREVNYLIRRVTALDGALEAVSATSKQAAADIAGVGVAMRGTADAAGAAAAGARSAAGAYQAAASAAASAAANIARANAIMARNGAPLFAGAPFAGGYGPVSAAALTAAARRALPPPPAAPIVPSPYSVYGARSFAGAVPPSPEYGPIPQPSWRSSAAAALATGSPAALTGDVDEEWRAAYRAGRTPFNRRAWWANWRATHGTDVPPGDTIPMGGLVPPPRRPRPGGGGGGGGADDLAGFAVPGRFGHIAFQGAKYVALAGAAAATDAVYTAARLQTLMIGVQNATGATDRQMENIRQQVFKVGDLVGISPVKSGEVFANIARSSGGVFMDRQGRFDTAGFMAIAPTIAELAQIQHLTRGVSVESAATEGVRLAHLFRQYSGTGFNQIADYLTRLSEMMPDSLSVARRQFAYFLPTFKALGISDKDSIATMALLDRLGYGQGKGGTNMHDLINASLGGLQLTKHAQVGKTALLEQMGVLDKHGRSVFFTDHKADLVGFLKQLRTFAQHHGRSETITDFKAAFGVQGGRIATLALDPQFTEQLKKIEQVMENRSISLPEQMKRYDRATGFQLGRAYGNVTSVLTELGYEALPGVTSGLKELADKAHDAQVWLHHHRDAEQAFARVARDTVSVITHSVEAAGKIGFVVVQGMDLAAGGLRNVARAARAVVKPLADAERGLMGIEHAATTVAGRLWDWVAKHTHGSLPTTTQIKKRMHDAGIRDDRFVADPKHPWIHGLPSNSLLGVTMRMLGLDKSYRVKLSGYTPDGTPIYTAEEVKPPRRDDGRARADQHHRAGTRATGNPQVHVTIQHLDARGMSRQEAEQVVREGVRKGVRDAMGAHGHNTGPDPRSHMRRSGAATTSPTLPMPVTVPPGT